MKKGILPRSHIQTSTTSDAESVCFKSVLKRGNEHPNENIAKVIKLETPSTSQNITISKLTKEVVENKYLVPNPKPLELRRTSSSSTMSVTHEEPQLQQVRISQGITTSSEGSTTIFTSSEEYIFPTATPSTSGEFITEPIKRLQSTEMVIQQHSRFYLGLPQDVYCLVKMICERTNVIHRDVLITLKKIRLDDTYFRLHVDFELSLSQVQKIFVKTVPKLSIVMNNFIFWPEASKIQDLIPLVFRARYAKVQSIIDCFEVQIEKPSHPVLQSNTWSDYKQCNTVKFLISCTPNGFINFISQAYPGRISDKNIVAKSGYLARVPNGAYILADRGFKHVHNMLLQKNCILIRPASVGVNDQSTAKDVKESRQIASIRIHIERIIRRVREFHILHPHACTNHHLVHLMSHFALIACGIINFQKAIL